MLKTKIQSPTSAIIIIIAAASGSSTQPMLSGFLPKLNQVKFRTARNPGACNVAKNAEIDNTSATTWAMMASAAALLRCEFAKLKITSEAASGTAGITQRFVTSQLMGRLRSRAPAFAKLRRGRRVRARVRNSSFELIELIDVGRAIVAINGDDQRKSDRSFRRGNGDRKDCDHYPGRLMRFGAEAPERDKVEVRCCEHHLDADQDEN